MRRLLKAKEREIDLGDLSTLEEEDLDKNEHAVTIHIYLGGSERRGISPYESIPLNNTVIVDSFPF